MTWEACLLPVSEISPEVRICAAILPTKSNKAIPHQLSHFLKSPFLGTGISTALHQSEGTLHSSHT